MDNPPDPLTPVPASDPVPQTALDDGISNTLAPSTLVSVRDRPLTPLPRPLTYQEFFVLHFFSGQRRECDLQWHLEDLNQGALLPVLVLSLDVANDTVLGDLTNNRTVALWLDLLIQGKVVGVLAGPPCETWSAARFLDGGPPPVRSLTSLWGEPTLTVKLQMQVSLGNRLLRTSLLFMYVAFFLEVPAIMEHPAPGTTLRGPQASGCQKCNISFLWAPPFT